MAYSLREIDQYLAELLKINEIKDYSLNGIQFGNKEWEIKKIALAVDSSLSVLEKAKENKANLLICHHGFFWGKPLAITGVFYDKIATLMKNPTALYAIHLPLDCHPTYGNNIILSQKIGLENCEPFGFYNGIKIGFCGQTTDSLETILEKCAPISSSAKYFIFNKNRVIRKVAVVSGKAGNDILEQFLESGADLFITGEIEHSSYNLIKDTQSNVIALGHYDSEKLGILAIGKHLEEKMGIESFFIEEPTGF